MSVTQETIVIPSSPADRDDIFRVIKSLSDSKTRAKGESDYQREAIAELSKKYDLPAKHIRKMLKDYHAQAFEKGVQELEEYQALYEAVFGSSAEGTAEVVIDEEE